MFSIDFCLVIKLIYNLCNCLVDFLLVELLNSTEIIKVRLKLGLTQTDLAAVLGVAPMTVSRWERSIGAPGPFHVGLLTQFECAGRSLSSESNLRHHLANDGAIGALYYLLHKARGSVATD